MMIVKQFSFVSIVQFVLRLDFKSNRKRISGLTRVRLEFDLPIWRGTILTLIRVDHHRFASWDFVVTAIFAVMVIAQMFGGISSIQYVICRSINCSLVRFPIIAILNHVLAIWGNDLNASFERIFFI